MLIKISQGFETLIDDNDYEQVSKYNWCAQRGFRKDYIRVAVRMKNEWIYLHRFLINAKKGEYVDHINGNSLDNRRCNLRITTNAQNLRNQRLRSDNTSGYKGVFKNKDGKYSAYIWKDYKKYHLGRFINKKEAAEAYNKAAQLMHGEFARLNHV